MRKKIIPILVSMLFLFTMLSVNVFANSEKNNANINPTITVRGGREIKILVYGVEDETSIAATVDGAFMYDVSYSKDISGTRIILRFKILDGFFTEGFILHVSIDDQNWSFECKSFLCFFVYGITPI
jgi:hypothetical protein